MTLLPDMRFCIGSEEHRLSLQDPYTLDGVLIDNVAVDCSNDYASDIYGTRIITARNDHIRIRNQNGHFITLDKDILEHYIRNEINRFLAQNHCSEIRIGESSRYRWTLNYNYNINNYISDLREQCYKMSGYYSMHYMDECIHRLYLQDRYTLTATSVNNNDTYYTTATSASAVDTLSGLSNAVSHTASSCRTLSSAISDCIDNVDALRYAYISEPLSSQEVIKIKPEKKYIHEYNYKPEYIKHYMPDEYSSLLLGAEIEVDCGGESEEHAKKVLEIVCGINPDNVKEALEDKMYCTHDGSLKAGIEFDTMPCTLEYHKKEMKYKEMFEYLDKNGYKAHDTTTCGLHVHADRSYLGKSELVQQLTISKILYILEKFNNEICVIARRNNSYSKFVGKSEVNQSLDKLYGKYSSDKHVALNLKHKDSIEFRCFKGTLKYETFILTLEFVKNIIDYAKSINIEEIELIQWNDLMNTFSEELKEYYNERLEKENNKSDDKNDKKKTIDVSSISSATFSFENASFNLDLLNNLISGASSAFSNFGGYIRNTNIESNVDKYIEIELKKKEIKSLKKKLKNSNNYIEKKKLNQELDKLNKELKKLKKKSVA